MRHSVVHILAPAAFGGLESVVHLLAVGQAARSHRVTVCAITDDASHPFIANFDRTGVQVVPVIAPGRAYRRERAQVRDILRTVRPTLVHTHGYRPDVLHLSLAHALGVPTVTTLHGFTAGDWKNRVYERLQLRAASRATAAIAVSASIRDRLVRVGIAPARVHVIRNGFDPSRPVLDRVNARARLGLSRDATVVGWIGRLSAEKGPDVMLRSLVHLPANVTLAMIGAGPEQDAIEALAGALGVRERVSFHGIVPDAGRLVTAFDTVALSSRTEGTPIVLLEALAARVPVVATAVGGVPDVVSDREAVLVSSESPESLAAAISAVLQHPAEATSRAQRGAERLACELSLDGWLARHDQLYDTLV